MDGVSLEFKVGGQSLSYCEQTAGIASNVRGSYELRRCDFFSPRWWVMLRAQTAQSEDTGASAPPFATRDPHCPRVGSIYAYLRVNHQFMCIKGLTLKIQVPTNPGILSSIITQYTRTINTILIPLQPTR